MAGGGFHKAGESESGRGSIHLKGLSTIHVNPLHSHDFTPLVSHLSATINHFTGVSRSSSKDGEMRERVFVRSSRRLGRETVENKRLFWVLRRSHPSPNAAPRLQSYSPNRPVYTRRVTTEWTPTSIRVRNPFPQPSRRAAPSQPPQVSTMEAKSQRLKGKDGAISALNVAIETLNLAKEVSSITPAKAVFGSVSVILTMIKVSLLFFF